MTLRPEFRNSTPEERFPAIPEVWQSRDNACDQKRAKFTAVAPHFSLLGSSAEDRKRRWLVLGISPVLEALAVAIMVWALMSLPPNPVTNTVKEEVLYFHMATPPEPIKQNPRLLERPFQTPAVAATPISPTIRPKEIQKPLTAEHLKIPKVPQLHIQLPETPAPQRPAEAFTSVVAPKPMHKQQVAMVHTGDFNPGSMAKGNLKRPLHEVQTGGFGADNGIPNNPAADSHNRIAQLGSFDLPSGPGYGNGTGGARGVRGTVSSAGFGNGIGTGTGFRPTRAAPETVQQGGFGSVVAGKASRTKVAPESPAFKPVIILAKPVPVYPDEARRQHIEGQVILRVLFGSSGNLRVLKVEQGLGHGMDAAAIEAAEHIKFKPAERDGSPVDSIALVHIIFQLAY